MRKRKRASSSRLTRDQWIELYGLCYGAKQDSSLTVKEHCAKYGVTDARLRQVRGEIESWLEEDGGPNPFLLDNPELTIKLLEDAEQLGIKLEIVGDTPTWEAFPMLRHQGLIDVIRFSFRRGQHSDRGFGCFHYSDIFVQFADGSVKRPDISVFCQEPVEKDSPVTMLPDAVVEVLSRGYEGKDLKVGVPFYLRQGVKDVVVVDPRSGSVLHFAGDKRRELQAPVTVELACGCCFDVPAPVP